MSEAYSVASNPASAVAIGVVFRAIGFVLLLAATLLFAVVLRPHWEERGYRYSEPVRAQVVALERDRAVLGFRYIHQGQLYAGERFAIGAAPDPARLNHRHGDWITVKIDPRHPERSMARPGLSPRDRFGIAAAVVLLGAAALLLLLPGALRTEDRSA